MGYGQKVFFIEKLSCNKYLIHQTHLGYDWFFLLKVLLLG
jgi:hypothetical protein